jgi:hypothetical protein
LRCGKAALKPGAADVHLPSSVRVVALSLLAAAAGCAGLPEASLEVPAALQGTAPERIGGLGGARRGQVQLGGLSGRFERSAEPLDTDDGQGRAVSLRCSGRQVEVEVGIGNVSAQTRPWRFGCEVQGALQGQLVLQGERAGGGMRDERHGRWSAGPVQLELRSLHRWAGAAWPSPMPVGYVVLDGAREVGLLELNGPAPRLWRPAPAGRFPPLSAPSFLARGRLQSKAFRFHGAYRDEIRRNLGRRHRPHPQCGAPCQTRGRCRP